MLVTANIFQPLIDVFEAVLKFIHNSVGVPWGWSIVLLTVCVRALLIPLTVKQFGSMQRMQQLQPQMKEIQAKYKEDKERQQQEMMKFYKENKVNPLGSCLPLAAQLPVFISLFYMLRKTLRGDICPGVQAKYVHLHGAGSTTPCGANHGAGFLFINDLTNSAKGAVLIVLIVLYVGTQLASSLMMSSSTMEKTQRQIMLFMPLVFVFFIIGFPAGVIVYWITTNTWTILQQYVVKRRLGPPVTPVVAAATTTPGGSGSSRGGGARSGASVEPEPNGSSGAGGGIGALLRRAKPEKEKAGVGASGQGRAVPPPRPPRKKKKRSGRRR